MTQGRRRDGQAGDAVTAEELSRKVRGLELRARKMTGGLISGAYHSAFKGRGIEFLDVREYVPGDDTRAIDWNVTARAGHPFVKRYAEERDETVMLLVDGSLSMRIGSDDMAKCDAKCNHSLAEPGAHGKTNGCKKRADNAFNELPDNIIPQ